MKKVFFLAIFAGLSAGSLLAGTIITGGNLYIGEGAFYVESGDLTLGSSGSITLNSTLSVGGDLTLENDLDLNGQTIQLGTTGTLVENAGRLYGTSGAITATRTLNAPTAVDVAGLGAVLTSAANLGATTVTRRHGVYSVRDSSINRSYQISPSNNSGLNATLRFNYQDAELNGVTESELTLFYSTDSGSTWTSTEGTLDATANTITLTGIDAFSLWTAAAQYGTPVVGSVTLDRNSGQSLKFQLSSLLANSSDPQDSVLTITSIDSVTDKGGAVSTNGAWGYHTPPEDDQGLAEYFNFEVSNEYGKSATGQAEILVIAADLPDGVTLNSISQSSTGSGMQLKFIGIPGRSYKLQACTDLGVADWQTLAEKETGATGLFEHLDEYEGPARFYRMVPSVLP